MKPLDLTGQRFGRLTAVELITQGPRLWRCVCECGRQTAASATRLRRGVVKSCGCYRAETLTAIGDRSRTHGMSRTRIYANWNDMRDRCNNPHNRHYARYGGRGITVCARWQSSFENFLADMGPRPPGTTIDRIDNDGGYCPGNCRWATPWQQANNTRASHYVEALGTRLTLAQWSQRTGIHRKTISDRIRSGWSPERALQTPPRGKRQRA